MIKRALNQLAHSFSPLNRIRPDFYTLTQFSNVILQGGDDRRVVLWNFGKAVAGAGQPHTMKGEHTSNIFCLAFDSSGRRLFSAGNDEQVFIHDVETGEALDLIPHDEAIYGISVINQDPSFYLDPLMLLCRSTH